MQNIYNLFTTPCAPLLSLFIRKPAIPLDETLKSLVDKKDEELEDLEVTIQAITNVIIKQKAIRDSPSTTQIEKRKITRRLVELVKTLKQTEKRLEVKQNLQQNMSTTAIAHENLADAAQDFVVMKKAQREITQLTRRFNADDVAKVQSDIQDSIDLSNEVVDILSTPLQTSSSSYMIDESTLDAELNDIIGITDSNSITTPPSFNTTSPYGYPTNSIPISIPAYPSSSSSLPSSSATLIPN